MVPCIPGKPEEPGPNPQSCDTDCSQSREWGHQGSIGHFQEGQEGHFQVLGAQEGHPGVTEFRQPLQVQSHLEMPRILVQLGHTQRT